MRNQNKNLSGQSGFTLIELLVVVAIIALLSSVALIAFMSARQKARDAKRVADMVQMNNALELYFAANRGYPSGPGGIPSPLVPTAATHLPSAPLPPDGGCEIIDYHDFTPAIPDNTFASSYYYYPSGTTYLGSAGEMVYPDYEFSFCLGNLTGNIPAGPHKLTPQGIR